MFVPFQKLSPAKEVKLFQRFLKHWSTFSYLLV